MAIAQSLNETYKKWKDEPEPEAKAKLERQLVKLLEKLALAICWKRIPDLRGEFSWVANESIWRAISAESRFGGKSQFSVWFFRIVVNECNRLLRRTKKIRDRSVPLEFGDVSNTTGVYRRGLGLREEVARLGWEDQTLVALKSEGWSTREIAEMLETTEAAVKMRWMRLRGRLRDGLV